MSPTRLLDDGGQLRSLLVAVLQVYFRVVVVRYLIASVPKDFKISYARPAVC